MLRAVSLIWLIQVVLSSGNDNMFWDFSVLHAWFFFFFFPPREQYVPLHKQWAETIRLCNSDVLTTPKAVSVEEGCWNHLTHAHTTDTHPPIHPPYSGAVGLEQYRFSSFDAPCLLQNSYKPHTITQLSPLPTGLSVVLKLLALCPHRHYRLYCQLGCQRFWRKSCQLWL